MELSQDRSAPGVEALFVMRAKAWPYLVLGLFAWGCVAAGVVAVMRIEGIHWLLWVVMGPIALATGLIFGLLAGSFVGAFRSARRPTNWVAAVQRDSLRLNLRDHRNAHFDGDDPTTVHIQHAEIASAGKLTETHREQDGDGVRIVRMHWVAITLKDVTTTEDLAIACLLEATREAPSKTRLGITSRTKHHAVTVRVDDEQRILVRWGRDLLNALSAHLAIAEPRCIDLDHALQSRSPAARVAAHVKRGLPISAVREARSQGATLRQAKDAIRPAEPC